MIRGLADVLSRWSARWVPDPFVIAILLTLVTMAAVWATTGTNPLDAIGHWGGRIDGGELIENGKEKGLFSLLLFAMQMCLVLVSGYALASAPVVRRGVNRLARLATSPMTAIFLTATVAMVAGFLNWGLGLIVGALMARDVGRSCLERGIKVHYPLLGAAGYTGLLIWHGGLSGSAPLKLTTEAGISTVLPEGVTLAPIPLSETIGSSLNITVTLLLLALVPLILWAMHPKRGDAVVSLDAFEPAIPPPSDVPTEKTPAQRLEHSFILAALVVVMICVYLAQLLDLTGLDSIGLNTVNLFFIGLGLLLHGSLKAYGDAIAAGTRSCSGVILQFPFYAGIMGMIALSGMMQLLSTGIADVAGESGLAPLTFLSAGAVNLFVPSGGGQFAIQGGILVEAAQTLDVSISKTIMAFCYGDQWTNMLQPFWALPLLGITGLGVKDLIGYTAALMLCVIPLFVVPLMLF